MSAPLTIDAKTIELLTSGTHPTQQETERALVLLAREGNLKGVVTKPARYSATTIQWYIDCKRKYYWPAIAGLEDPPSKQQKFGTTLHSIQETYLNGGAQPDRSTPEGHLASIGLALLPKPGAPGLYVEQPFETLFEGLPVAITGTRDFGVDPTEQDAKGFLLGDHKTKKDKRYPMNKTWLALNVQANLYAYTKWAELLARGFDKLQVVDKQWIYYYKAEREAEKLRAVDSLDHVADEFDRKIKPAVIGMHEMVSSAPRIEDVPATKSACQAYGGCKHLSRCFGMGAKNEATGAGAARFSRDVLKARASSLDAHPNVKDLTGQTIGRLTVLRRNEKGSDEHRRALWDVRCSCGFEKILSSLDLQSVRSCGCLRREQLAQRNETHGLSHEPEYVVWKSMNTRCNNPNAEKYKDYGGRGIKVCERWEDFALFYEDMGPRPTKNHSIDRIDNDKGYEPDNCRWATAFEQRMNQRPRGATTKESKLGLLAGKFTKDAINAKAAAAKGAPQQTGASVAAQPKAAPARAVGVNPPPARKVAPPPEVEESTETEATETEVVGEIETQEEAAPESEEKPKRGRPKKATEAAPAQTRTSSGSARTPGGNSGHDFWLFVDCDPTFGFTAAVIPIERIVGGAQADAAEGLNANHYRTGQGSYGALEAAFAAWMEQNAIVGAVKVSSNSIVARDVVGLLRAHATMVVEGRSA